MAILNHQFQRETSQSSSNSLLAGTSQSSSTSLFAEKCKVFKKEPITKYKQLINEAAFELSIETPTLLCDRKALLTSARKRVHDNGYEYKKGKSRPVQLDHRNANKRQKIDASTRTKQLSDLEQRLNNINLSIKMKQNRCQESEKDKNYKLCDELMSDISALLVEQQLIESELSTLKRKGKKSYWYHRRRSSSTSDLDLSGSSYSGTSSDMFSPMSEQADNSFQPDPFHQGLPCYCVRQREAKYVAA